jgi:hypothetical protein
MGTTVTRAVREVAMEEPVLLAAVTLGEAGEQEVKAAEG